MKSRHFRFLERNVFQVDTKWPHYRRLLTDLEEFLRTVPQSSKVVCLERAFVFGGQSLFAPLFDEFDFMAIDIRLAGLEPVRFSYQSDWLNHPDCDARPVDAVAFASELPLETNSVDLLLVPNVVHHVSDQKGMFEEFARVLKPSGRGFIFETLLRELHQIPFDFVRWTPWGFAQCLQSVGLSMSEWRPAGGPFEAIAYCWDQALQYLPEDLRGEWKTWFEEKHFPVLMSLHESYSKNLVRQHTSFPIAYAIHFTKPLEEPSDTIVSNRLRRAWETDEGRAQRVVGVGA